MFELWCIWDFLRRSNTCVLQGEKIPKVLQIGHLRLIISILCQLAPRDKENVFCILILQFSQIELNRLNQTDYFLHAFLSGESEAVNSNVCILFIKRSALFKKVGNCFAFFHSYASCADV